MLKRIGCTRHLIRAGLVDEYRLVVHSVALAAGLPLFTDLPDPIGLRLLRTMAFDTGAVLHVHGTAA
jgi:dihydrofolate reductase